MVMNNVIKIFTVFLLMLNKHLFINCDQIGNQMYFEIQSSVACVRRANATHEIGCSNLDVGSYDGVLYIVRTPIDLAVFDYYDRSEKKKLIIATTPQMFEQVLATYHQNASNKHILNGILLIDSQNVTLNSYSDDYKQPNEGFSYYHDKPDTDWNGAGTSNMFVNHKIPIYYVYNDTEIDKLYSCYSEFNQKIFYNGTNNKKIEFKSDDKLCGIQLGIEMYSAVNSRVCLRRRNIQHTLEGNTFCDPLGGVNYFSYLSMKPSLKLPIIMVNTIIDSFTLFEFYTPGANQPISSIIGLMAIADLLSNYRTQFTKYDLLFTLFDNDAFDYGGSSRFVYNLMNNLFPGVYNQNKPTIITLDYIKAIVELGQLGSVGLDQVNKLFIHHDPITYNSNSSVKADVDYLTQLLQSQSSSNIQPVTNQSQFLPPSSFQTFLKNQFQIPGVVIADHEIEFTNKYFHSVFDTPARINVTFPANISEEDAANYNTLLAVRLQNLTTSIAGAIYSFATNQSLPATASVDIKLLNRLIYCFYKNPLCYMFRSVFATDFFNMYNQSLQLANPKMSLSFYTSVNNATVNGKFVADVLLRYFTRDRSADSFNSTECTLDKVRSKLNTEINNVWFVDLNNLNTTLYKGTICIASSVYQNYSLSPALLKVDDGIIINNKTATWTESSWGATGNIKMFVFATDVIQNVSISIGVFVFALSAILTFLANNYSSKWISDSTGETGDEMNNL